MSEQKTIRINPDLFRFSTTHKTRKKPPRDPNNPIRIKSDRQNRTVKNSKRQLLKYIREHQAQNYKQFSDPSTSSVSIKPMKDESADFNSDFENSLKYLESVSAKAQQTASANRHNSTLRNHHAPESLLFGSTLSNVVPYDMVDVNIPDVFSTISPTTPETVRVYPRASVSAPKYGCLKNGALPTYRMWKNQTMKTSSSAPTPKPTPMPSSRMHSFASSHPANTGISIIGGARPTDMMRSSAAKPERMRSEMARAADPSAKGNVEDMRAHESYRTQQKLRKGKPKRNQKQKRILRRTFRLGKSKHYPNVSVLVSNKTIRNQTTTRAQLLKQVPLDEIKKTLMKRGLIKVGSTAPADVLRKMYESVTLMCGDLHNHNPDNLLYNYFNAGDQL
jgi:hypothetical protein